MTRTTAEAEKFGEIAAKEQTRGRPGTYCLMTAAYNEEENIGRTIESVLSQTLLPERWVIISDGSVDKTDEIIKSYAEKHAFIRFLRMARDPGRSFSRKVMALRAGSKLLEDAPSTFIGNLDADISVDPAYFEKLLAYFDRDPKLGIAGGFVCESTQGEFKSRPSNRTYSVAHAAQLVRRECYEQIGGYAGCKYGGEDWHAQTAAKMAGWQALAFPELRIFHHRRTGEAENILKDRFRLGQLDYCFGSQPLFEFLKCLQRLPERPLLVGGALRFLGFSWSFLSRDHREFSETFINFLRTEQKQKLFSVFAKAVPNFHSRKTGEPPRS